MFCQFDKCLYVMVRSSGGSRISRRGGRRPRGGTPTPEAVTFRKFCMSKGNNVDP